MAHNFVKQVDGSKVCSWCRDEKNVNAERDCPRTQSADMAHNNKEVLDAVNNIRHDFQEERKELLEIIVCEGKACTSIRSERASEMERSGQMFKSKALDEVVKEMQINSWPEGASENFPSSTSKKVEECQPFVSQMLGLFASGSGKVNTHDGKKRSVKVYSIPHPKSSNKKKVLHNISPDIVCYDGNKSGTLAITQIAEVTGGGVNTFSMGEEGKMTESMTILMDEQPLRMELISYLTDGNRFQFYRCKRSGRGKSSYLQFERSSVFSGKDGWQMVFGQMLCSPAALGHEVLQIEGFTVGDLLGSGSLSDVFKAYPQTEVKIQSDRGHSSRVQFDRNISGRSQPASKADGSSSSQNRLQLDAHEVDTGAEGNCVFSSLAHSLTAANVRFRRDDDTHETYTNSLLRGLVASNVETDARFRLQFEPSGLADLDRVGGWVDPWAIGALAQTLGVNITIYGGPDNEPILIDAQGHVHVEQLLSNFPSIAISFDRVIGHYRPVIFRGDGAQQGEGSSFAAVALSAMEECPSAQPVHRLLPVAVKVFSKESAEQCQHRRDHEVEMLRRMEWCNNVPSVVRAELTICGHPSLIVSPAGTPVQPAANTGVTTTPADYVALLQVLLHAHRVNLCHRDVKPQNIFKDQNGRIILSDWSSAAEMGVETEWEGTLPFYERFDMHIPCAVNDLIALVRSDFVMYTRNLVTSRIDIAINSSMTWRSALAMAKSCEYDGLRSFFSKL